MRSRLVTSALLITVAGVLVLGIPLGILGSHLITQDAHNRLERDADELASALEDRFEENGSVTRSQVGAAAPKDLRVVVAAGGTLVRSGTPVTSTRLTATSNTGQGLTVRVSEPSSPVTARIRNIWLLIAALALAGIGAGAVLGIFEARRISAPLVALADTSDRLGEGDFSARAERASIPELDAAARALNRSAEQIAELVADERRLANSVSHQLRTPLTAMRIRLEEALLESDLESARREMKAAVDQVDRLSATIDELMSLTRTGRLGQRTQLDLMTVAGSHVERWTATYGRESRRLIFANGTSTPPVLATAGGVGQALDVVLDNSVKHGMGATTVALRETKRRVIVRVSDEGGAIAPGMEDKIFRWETSSGKGHGIGLAIARALVESDGGRLDLVAVRPPAFEISYPVAEI